MSDSKDTTPATPRPQTGPGGRPGGGGFFGGGGRPGMAPVAKAKDFVGSAKRLAGTLKPEMAKIVLVMVLAVVSVTFAVVAPKIMSNATNVLFQGVIGKALPKGATEAQVVAMLKAKGGTEATDLAAMIREMHVTPGVGVDFGLFGRELLLLGALYALSALFMWAQGYLMVGVAQRTVYEMRKHVDEKLAKLPLRYYDDHPRGDILSRVTNDIDNIANSLQQSATQLITSVFTIVGVLIAMLLISPLLALISLLVIPLALYTTVQIAKRSQKQFALQWEETGDLNGHVEEMHTGHSIVKIFGRQDEAIEVFDERNEKLFQSSFKAQFISGAIQPAMTFLGNLNYVGIAVIGGIKVATGTMSLGDVLAFVQYSRQFTQPITQTASIANVLQSAVASAERVFELLDEEEEQPDTAEPLTLAQPQGHVTFEHVDFAYDPAVPLIEDMNLDAKPGQTVAIVGPTGAGKTTLVNLLMRFYEIDAGPHHGRRYRHARPDARRAAQDVRHGAAGRVAVLRARSGRTSPTVSTASPKNVCWRRARAANVDHFVRTLTDGYETMLDDEASNVSQGEKQLLTIARAFLADPEILILDEATSSVDTRTEVLIQKGDAPSS